MNMSHIPLHSGSVRTCMRMRAGSEKPLLGGRGKKSFSANSYQVPQQTRQIASNKIRLMLLFVLAYMFLKFYFLNYFTFLSVFFSTPIQLLPTELSSTF